MAECAVSAGLLFRQERMEVPDDIRNLLGAKN